MSEFMSHKWTLNFVGENYLDTYLKTKLCLKISYHTGQWQPGFLSHSTIPRLLSDQLPSSEELLSSPSWAQWQSFTTTLATQAHGPITGRHQSPKPGQSEHFPESNTHTWVKAVLLVPGLDKNGTGSPGASDSHLCHLRRPSHRMRPRGDGLKDEFTVLVLGASKVLWTIVFSLASPVSSPLKPPGP